MTDQGWTVVTLKELLERQIADLALLQDERKHNQDAALSAALEAAEKAVTKAQDSTEQRLEAANGFKELVLGQAATFLTRIEYDNAHQALVEKVDAADKSHAAALTALEQRLQDRASGTRGQMIALAGVFLTALAIAATIIIATR